MSLTTSQYVTLYNEAIDAFSLALSPVKKFSTLADAQRRVGALCEKHGLEICEREGKSPILVKRTTSVTSNTDSDFEMTQAERDAQSRPTPSTDETIGDDTATTGSTDTTGTVETTDDTYTGTDTSTTAGTVETPTEGALAAHTKKNREKKEKAAPAERKPRTPRVNREPRKVSELHECREGTNQAHLVDMLFDGATLSDMTSKLNALQGKKLSESVVYSTILYDVCTVKGYGVTSKLTDDDKPFFKLVLPAGMPRPLPHIKRKQAAEPAKSNAS